MVNEISSGYKDGGVYATGAYTLINQFYIIHTFLRIYRMLLQVFVVLIKKHSVRGFLGSPVQFLHSFIYQLQFAGDIYYIAQHHTSCFL